MQTDLPDEPAELVYAPEGPTGVSAQQYRGTAYAFPGLVLTTAVLTVRLLDDPNRARFTFECLLQAADESLAEVEFATEEWAYDIPALDGEISEVSAWDGAGTLQTELEPAEGKATRLRVRFRRMVHAGRQYRFWYAYVAPVRAFVAARVLTRMVVCSGWVIFNLPCDSTRVCIELPERARLLKCVPSGDVMQPEPGGSRVRYQVERLRALETSQWLVAYQRRRLGLPLYLWMGAQLAAGLVGWMIGRALDGWTGRG